ncbi:MAG: FkbM family methyltransferase [Acidobacteriota bacterium]|nr:FkbM family methyltransferase [Acidobacteriota bacterium]
MISLQERFSALIGFAGHKYEKFKYANPAAGLLFTLTQRHYHSQGLRFAYAREQTSLRFRSQYYYDIYEKSERTLVHDFIRPDDRVLELGACIGVVSCTTNRLLKAPGSRHVVVEANPELIPLLRRNRELNDCDFRIEHGIVSDGKETTFFVADRIHRGSVHEGTGAPLTVPSLRLGELERKYGPFNVLVIDIQGAEIDVLRHWEGFLGHYRLVIVEWHAAITGEAAISDARERLRNAGLRSARRLDTVEAWVR